MKMSSELLHQLLHHVKISGTTQIEGGMADFKQMRLRCCNDRCVLKAKSPSHLHGMWNLGLNPFTRPCVISQFCSQTVNSAWMFFFLFAKMAVTSIIGAFTNVAFIPFGSNPAVLSSLAQLVRTGWEHNERGNQTRFECSERTGSTPNRAVS